MTEIDPTAYLVPEDGSFRVADAPTGPPKGLTRKKDNKKRLKRLRQELIELQRRLYADDRYALLLIFQALDAAGKDGTIRAVLSGVNPAGCQVFSFKQPSAEELEHDFLWRTSMRLPERGRIGVFNRSYYEEVLVVRVHPEYLDAQKLPQPIDLDRIWSRRLNGIREHEKHLAGTGTVILKFWLNVSKEEQRKRLLSRIDRPEKNWKFAEGDLHERGFWKDYMRAFEEALNETSRPRAPWYAIPADDKPFMRACVAEVVVRRLRQLNLRYPVVVDADRTRLQKFRKQLADKKG